MKHIRKQIFSLVLIAALLAGTFCPGGGAAFVYAQEEQMSSGDASESVDAAAAAAAAGSSDDGTAECTDTAQDSAVDVPEGDDSGTAECTDTAQDSAADVSQADDSGTEEYADTAAASVSGDSGTDAVNTSGIYEETYIPDVDALADNEELFAQYVESVLYDEIDDAETTEDADSAAPESDQSGESDEAAESYIAETSDETKTSDEAAASDEAGVSDEALESGSVSGLETDIVTDTALASDYGLSYYSSDAVMLSVYSQLREEVALIAAQGGSTWIYLPTSVTFTYSNTSKADLNTFLTSSRAQLLTDFEVLVDCLMADCPAELYWYDKTAGTTYGYSVECSSSKCTLTVLYVKMSVCADYQGSGSLEVDAEIASAAWETAAAAADVVEAYASLGDEEKLIAYKDWICNAVSYNQAAVSSSYSDGYGDPWQMIYVFDGDNTTNVVCEGYAKAFQYLCDLSDFEDDTVNCYTITGTINSGGHMWNIVRMVDGLYYHADLTNSDTGTAGADGSLFLAGCVDGSMDEGYTFTIQTTSAGTTLLYTYDDSAVTLYGSAGILTLAEADYVQADLKIAHSPASTQITYGSGASLTVSVYAVCASSALSMQWYQVTGSGSEAVSGGTSLTLTLSGPAVGTYQYYCVITDGTNTVTSRTATVTVSQADLSGAAVTLSQTSYTYNGAERTPTPTVQLTQDGSTVTLKKGTDYSVTYSDNIGAGTATVKVTGKGGCTGTVSATFTINAKTVSSATVTLSKTSYTYNGTARKPTPTVKLTLNGSTVTLKKGTDYTVSYSNNKKAGTATVKITGKGNYKGTVKKTFTIKKKAQSLTVKKTAKTVKYTSVKKKKQTVKAITKVTGAKGKVTYTKSSGSKYLTVNKSTGRVSVKKGTPKGTYKIKIKVRAAATTNYKATTKTVTVTIKVK